MRRSGHRSVKECQLRVGERQQRDLALERSETERITPESSTLVTERSS